MKEVFGPFSNGYSTSVVKNQYSYGSKQGLYELAVVGPDGSLSYDTPITDDVIGYLTWEKAMQIVQEIKNLRPEESYWFINNFFFLIERGEYMQGYRNIQDLSTIFISAYDLDDSIKERENFFIEKYEEIKEYVEEKMKRMSKVDRIKFINNITFDIFTGRDLNPFEQDFEIGEREFEPTKDPNQVMIELADFLIPVKSEKIDLFLRLK